MKVSFGPWQSIRSLIAYVFTIFFLIPSGAFAQDHVVSPSDLRKQVVETTQTRQHQVETLQQFLSTPAAEKALKSANVDPKQVTTAVATLSDEDLVQLSNRAEKAQADFAAGNISDRDLLLILVAVAVIILIVVAVRN